MVWQATWPMLIPTAFALALRVHLAHPFLPGWLGDLPYVEAIVVQYLIWSNYCLVAARWRRARTPIACAHCGCRHTIALWEQFGICRFCYEGDFFVPSARPQGSAEPPNPRRRPERPLRLGAEAKARVRERMRDAA